MTISTENARQGRMSENHFVAKMVGFSTLTSFALLLLIAFGA